MKKSISILFIFCIVVCASETNATKQLNTITVTAQKAQENVLDVPIAMSIFDDISIEDKNVKDLQELTYFVPNFSVINLSFGPYSPNLRGIQAYRQGLNKSVGLYIDGALRYGGYGYENALDDVERVEVLRGPQGTLYGGNSEAGVINVITKKPDNKTEGKIGLEIGEDNKRKTALSIRTPLVKDKLFLGISGHYYEKDGFIKSKKTSNIIDDEKNYYGKIYLRSTPLDRLEISLISLLYRRYGGGQKRNIIKVKNPRIYEGNLESDVDTTFYSHILNVKYEFDTFNLSSVSVFSKDQMETVTDKDFGPKTLFHSFAKTPTKTFTEELKLDGSHNDLKWLTGIFLGKATKNFKWTNESIKPKIAGDNKQDVTEKHLGVFAHLNYALMDNLNVIGGVRFDHDTSKMKDYTRKFEGKKNFNNISPKLSLEYKPKPSLMTYATVAKGYRMGGFFPFAPANKNSYESEKLYNYEIGFKSNLLANKLQLNADIFYMNMTDKQVQAYINNRSAYVSNAAKSNIYGFEMDMNYLINRNLSLFGSLGLLEAKFDNFKDFKGDYTNNNIPFTPKYNYAIGGKFRGYGGFYVSANIRGYGKMYLDTSNKFERKSYSLVDGKIGYEWKNFDMYIYGNNIFDKNYDLHGYYGKFVFLNPSREVGIKLSYKF